MSRLSAAVLTLTGLLVAPLAAAQEPPTRPSAAPPMAAPTAATPFAAPQTPAVPARQSRPTQPMAPKAVPTPKPAAAPAPPDMAQQVNVRIELAISESVSGSPATRKTVGLLTSGNSRGSVRSSMRFPDITMNLSVDARPSIMKDGRIALDLIFNYTPERSQQMPIADLNEQMMVYLTDGKSLQISQSADPKGDRKVTVEVTATIVK